MNILFDLRDWDIIVDGRIVANWFVIIIMLVPIGLLVWRKIIHIKRRKAGLPVSWMEKRNDKKSWDRKFSMIEDTLGSSESVYIPKKQSKDELDQDVARLEKELAEAKAKQENNKLGG